MRRNFQVKSGVTVLAFFAPLSAAAADYYVATTGSDTATGTLAAPFATVGRAQTAAAAGDTVYIRGGTYAFTGSGTVGVSFTKSGSAGALIKYFAYNSEIPVFDLNNLTPSNRVTGLNVQCSYVHIRGLEVIGVQQYQSGSDSWGVRIQGSNNILERLNVHHNDAPGIFITSGANNQILNCDSHHNYDFLESGGSGDGFGCHSSGGNNLMSGCRAYDNSDDGFDFINATGTCTVEKSFSFRNGFIPDTTTAIGNGAGFKAGGYGSTPTITTGMATHSVRQCVAFGNRSQGFYANHHNARINFFNNTAFNNPTNYNMLADAGYPSDHVIRNNIAMATGTAIANLTGGTATFNSWNLSVTVSSADFLSVTQSLAQAPRNADGSLPVNDFMRLAAGSDLIDKGTDVGLPFVGSAPDLGAFESGAAGGTTGTGGASSTGGAATGGKATGGSASAGGAGTTGGVTATGGSLSAGGAVATGGKATGGSLSAGGAATGGKATGGSMSAGGAGGVLASTGGAASVGGNATGGLANAGGNATGGVASNNGGNTSTGVGGAVSAGGNATNGGATTTPTGTGGSGIGIPEEGGGCSCSVPSRTQSRFGLALFGLGALALLRRRRSH